MFDSDVFRQLMEFAHTGRLDLQPRTITGFSVMKQNNSNKVLFAKLKIKDNLRVSLIRVDNLFLCQIH